MDDSGPKMSGFPAARIDVESVAVVDAAVLPGCNGVAVGPDVNQSDCSESCMINSGCGKSDGAAATVVGKSPPLRSYCHWRGRRLHQLSHGLPIADVLPRNFHSFVRRYGQTNRPTGRPGLLDDGRSDGKTLQGWLVHVYVCRPSLCWLYDKSPIVREMRSLRRPAMGGHRCEKRVGGRMICLAGAHRSRAALVHEHDGRQAASLPPSGLAVDLAPVCRAGQVATETPCGTVHADAPARWHVT